LFRSQARTPGPICQQRTTFVELTHLARPAPRPLRKNQHPTTVFEPRLALLYQLLERMGRPLSINGNRMQPPSRPAKYRNRQQFLLEHRALWHKHGTQEIGLPGTLMDAHYHTALLRDMLRPLQLIADTTSHPPPPEHEIVETGQKPIAAS